jgi:uncharacterized protein
MDYPKEKLYNRPLSGMIINVTDACNLKCRYCFTKENPAYMELDTGVQAINWFIAENEKRKLEKYPTRLTISFFGGEPTLHWDDFIFPLINYVEEYINPNYKEKYDIHFSCTTNGQLLNEERIKWFIEHKGSFLLSIDGNRETQNYNRPRKDGKDSFEQINKNIDILLKYQPDLTFRSTITPEMCHNLFSDYLFARERGFLNWFAIPNVRQEWPQDKINILEEQMHLIAGCILRDIEKEQIPLSFNWLNKMIKLLFSNAPQKPHYMRCGLGTTSIGVATDGSLSACQENSTYHDENNLFYIGDIWNGINEERHLKLLEYYNGENKIYCNNECEKCYISHICQSISCPSTNYALTGSPLNRPRAMCDWLRILYNVASNLVLNAAELDSDNFINFIQSNIEFNKKEEEE